MINPCCYWLLIAFHVLILFEESQGDTMEMNRFVELSVLAVMKILDLSPQSLNTIMAD